MIISRCITHRGKLWKRSTNKLPETIFVLWLAEGGAIERNRIISVSKYTFMYCFIIDNQCKALIGSLKRLLRYRFVNRKICKSTGGTT